MSKIRVSKLNDQMSYFNKLKGMKFRELVRLHNEAFHSTKYALRLGAKPGTRTLAIRRLWFLYALDNYHYPKGSKEYNAFKQRAHQYLTDTVPNELPLEEQNFQRLQDKGYFSKESITRMPITEVDGYLVTIGVWADVEPSKRRRLLYEYMFGPEIDAVHNYEGRKHKGRHRVSNEYCLTDIILQFPTMTYNDMRRRFGEKMPTVTRGSFNTARNKLRKQGYKLPKLRPGPADPVIVDRTKDYAN